MLVDKLSSGFARVWWFSSPGWQKVFSLVLQALEWLDLTDPCLNQHCPSVALIMRHSPDWTSWRIYFLENSAACSAQSLDAMVIGGGEEEVGKANRKPRKSRPRVWDIESWTELSAINI